MACTFFPEGNWGPDCCGLHDKHYSKGSKVTRSDADRALRKCVTEKGHPFIAKIMYAGVRFLGWTRYKGIKND